MVVTCLSFNSVPNKHLEKLLASANVVWWWQINILSLIITTTFIVLLICNMRLLTQCFSLECLASRCLMISHSMIPRPRPLSSTGPHHWSRDERTLSWEHCYAILTLTALMPRKATGKLLLQPKHINVSWLKFIYFWFGCYKMMMLCFSIMEVLLPDLQFSNQRSYSSQLKI